MLHRKVLLFVDLSTGISLFEYIEGGFVSISKTKTLFFFQERPSPHSENNKKDNP